MSNSLLRDFFVHGVEEKTLETLLDPKSWRWLYAERMEATELLFLAEALAASVPWTRWKHGRAFDRASELDWWRRSDGRYDLRLLTGQTSPTIGEIDWGEAALWKPSGEPQETLLHGKRDDEAAAQGEARWSEARIPRWLHYPLKLKAGEPVPERVTLVIQTYKQDGIVGLTRLLAVTA